MYFEKYNIKKIKYLKKKEINSKMFYLILISPSLLNDYRNGRVSY